MDNNQKVFIVGATGFIGRHLVKILLDSGYYPVVLSRNPSMANELFEMTVNAELWDGKNEDSLAYIMEGAKAIVNLAGETIATRWTKEKKKSILESRINSTNAIVNAIKKCVNPPEVFVQASAIGYYPYNSNLPCDEDGPLGDGFLAQVVMKWEQAATNVDNKSRLVIIRSGVVLLAEGGFLSKILLPIKLFVGGWFGSGNQMISWIHMQDHVFAIKFLIENEDCKGIYNLVSPEPISYKKFVKRVGTIIKRPVWLPIPALILKLIFGQMAKEVILSNQSILPKRLNLAGFKFEFNSIDITLKDLLSK